MAMNPEKRLRQAAGDPWLPYAHITLKEDLRFALWGDWQYDAVYSDSEDEDSQNESLDDWYNSHGLQAFESKLSERIRSPPQREDFALQGVGHQVLRVASVSQSSFIHSTD
ncbi:hypothetical protein R3P38DRAFT_3177200 [Favolaschia claudopus]|uniref:Uncharacterized protein n=1 Tax=Favolaschia claudopus TaxID=2862362 RepID=A0AAW0D2Y8_9AGAR